MNNQKPKLLFISCMPYYQEKGSTLRTHATLKTLAKHYVIDAIVYSHGSHVAIPNVTIHRTPRWYIPKLHVSKPSISKIILDLFVFLKSFQLLFTNQYTHIHAEDFEAASLGSVLSMAFRKKYVYNLHNRIVDNWEISGKKAPWLVRWIEQIVIKYATLIIFNWGIYTQDPIFKDKDSFLHYDSVAMETQPVSYDLPEQYLFYAGNFELYQGIPFFLETYAQSNCTIPLLLAGNPTDEIRQLIKELHLEKSVQLLGRRSIEETNTLIQNSTFCILPRITGKQPSMKLIHYLTWKKPIIANDIQCNHELLKTFDTGIFYSSEDTLIEILNNLGNEVKVSVQNLEKASQFIKKHSNEKLFTEEYNKLV